MFVSFLCLILLLCEVKGGVENLDSIVDEVGEETEILELEEPEPSSSDDILSLY